MILEALLDKIDNFYKKSSHLTEKDELVNLHSDLYKEKNGIRPRWAKYDELSVDELKEMIKHLEEQPSLEDDDFDFEYNNPENVLDQPIEPIKKEEEFPWSKLDEFEKFPLNSGMGKRKASPNAKKNLKKYYYNEDGEIKSMFVPEDYEICDECGFDHSYEPEEAHKFHFENDKRFEE